MNKSDKAGGAQPARLPAVGYVRVSTDKQVERGISLQAQTAKIKAQATASGLRLTEIISDAQSGKSVSRAGLQRAIAAVEDGSVKAVIVWKLDRLTRSVRDLLYLLDLFAKHGARLISITESLDTDTPVGRMVLTILGAVAQMEREQIGERIRMAAQHMKQLGRVWGTTPWGFQRCGKRLVRNGAEVEAVKRAVQLRASGKTYAQIADQMNTERAHKPRTGKQWTWKMARRMVVDFSSRLKITMPAHCKRPPKTVAKGYRKDGPAHRRARKKVPAWRRREIAKLGAMGRARAARQRLAGIG